MPFRLLIHIPRKAIVIALYAALAAVVLFFALTRTEVGRDGLRQQMEARFAAQFEGQLRIGTLNGNLVNTLFARDVALYAPEGTLILSIDSVIARPRWRSLFRREIAFGDLTLIRPRLHLHRAADSTWNLARALRPRRPTSKAPDPWDVSATDLVIRDGRLETTRDGAPPAPVARGSVFDYTRALLDSLTLHATIDWQRDVRQVDLLHFHARLASPHPFTVETMLGQFVWEDSVLAVPQFSLRAGGSVVAWSGQLHHPEALREGAFDRAFVDVEVAPSRLDFDALRPLFPALPLADAVRVEARVEGALSALVVEQFSVARGPTRIAGGGTLFGLPDALDFEASFRQNVLHTRDLQAVLPGMPAWQAVHLDSLVAELYAEGVVPLRPETTGAAVPPLRVEATLDLQSPAGKVVGTVGLDQTPEQPLHATADLYTEALSLDLLLNAPALRTTLSGHIRAEATDLRADSLRGRLEVGLHDATLAGRAVDSLHVDLTAEHRVFTGTSFLQQGDGALEAAFTVDAQRPRPTYRLDARTRAFDLGPWLRNDSLATRFNTRLSLTGSGRADPELQGTAELTFEASTLHFNGVTRTVPPHRSRLRLAPRHAAGPRLALTGDLATLQVDGDVPLAAAAALGRLWGEGFARALRRHTSKVYRQPLGPPQPSTGIPPAARTRARTALAHNGLDALRLEASLRLHRSDILSALLPTLPPLATDLGARLTATLDANRLQLDASLTADTLTAGRFRADTLQTTLHASASLDAPLETTLDARLTLQADTAFFLKGFSHPTLTLRYGQRRATLRLETPPLAPDTLRLAATLDLLADRNRLTLEDLRLTAGDFVFSNPRPAAIDLYADAVVVPGLHLESHTAGPAPVQRLSVQGVLSQALTDTVYVAAEEVALRRLTDLIGFNPRFGGRVNGRFALTGGLRRPEVTGALSVETFSLDHHILGDLAVTSRYVRGLPDVFVDLALRPTRSTDTTRIHGTTLPALLTRNSLDIDGRLRLPRRGPDGTRIDPGTFDLALRVDRADLFFFERIIGALRQVQGYAAGTGTMRGTFSRPIFEAALAIREGAFDVPELNLRMTGEADVTVDADAIHIQRAAFTDKTGGTLTATGDVRFNDYEYFSFDLDAHLNEVEVIDVAASDELPFYGHLRASGDATLTGPLYNAHLRSTNAVTTPDSELFIPVTETAGDTDEGFIIFADSTGRIPDLRARTRRSNVLASRPEGERPFLEGMDLDIDLDAPPGSTVHLVIDPLLGDVINAVGSGRIQLQRREGEFFTFGTFQVAGGDYLFTAGEVFVRRFLLEPGGTITWDGDPIDAQLNIPASYRTRASRAGLPTFDDASDLSLIPVIVKLQISGRVTAPQVSLSLAIDRSGQSRLGEYEGLEALLNQPDRATEYATSVLLTNSFRLTTSSIDNAAGSQLAFTSVSQLVSSQLSRFLNEALPNVDFSVGLQGENAQDLDVTYGVALRLLDERLIIRGEGVYQGSSTNNVRNESLQGEFTVEIRLNPNVSVEIFYRREGDVLAENAALTNTTGAGLSYQTEFTSWKRLLRKLFGWLFPDKREVAPPADEPVATGQ